VRAGHKKLHISQPGSAGVARVAIEQATYEAKRGWDVHIACPSDSWLALEATQRGLGHVPWESERSPVRGVVTESSQLSRLIERLEPDLVHLHSAKAGMIGRLVVRRRIPTIFQPHAWSFDALSGPPAALATRWEALALKRWTSHLVCVSERERSGLAAARSEGNVTVVPNGVDLEYWRPMDRLAARQKLGIPKDVRVVVCVGRLSRQKGQDRLLLAWPRIRSRVPDAELYIVGTGSFSSHQAAQPGVFVVGEADPRPYYASADVVAVPSRWEGMALAPIEAIACGRHVVSFEVAGIKETLGVSGVVIPQQETDAFSAAIIDWLHKNPIERDVDELRARDWAKSHFSIHKSHRIILELSASLMACQVGEG